MFWKPNERVSELFVVAAWRRKPGRYQGKWRFKDFLTHSENSSFWQGRRFTVHGNMITWTFFMSWEKCTNKKRLLLLLMIFEKRRGGLRWRSHGFQNNEFARLDIILHEWTNLIFKSWMLLRWRGLNIASFNMMMMNWKKNVESLYKKLLYSCLLFRYFYDHC